MTVSNRTQKPRAFFSNLVARLSVAQKTELSVGARWWMIFAILLAPGQAYAQEGSYTIPLSASGANGISVDYICKADGYVGPFINTANIGSPSSGEVSIFSSVDLIKSATFFDRDKDSVSIVFPKTWRYATDTDSNAGFFVLNAPFKLDSPDGFPDAVRALTSLSQLYLLQFAAAKYIAADFGGRKYIAEINPKALTAEAIKKCFETAGYSNVLAKLKGAAADKMTPADLKQTCLAVYGFYNGLEDLIQGADDDTKRRMAGTVKYPTRERSDCFQTKQLSQPDLTKAAIEAASLATKLDYSALIQSVHKKPLPPAAYNSLKSVWGAKDIPGMADAEKEKASADQAAKIRYTYVLYARVLACVEAFKEVSGPPFTAGQINAMKQRVKSIETRFKDVSQSIWDDAMKEYPSMLASARYTTSTNSSAALDACAHNAGLFEIFAAKLGNQAAPPRL